MGLVHEEPCDRDVQSRRERREAGERRGRLVVLDLRQIAHVQTGRFGHLGQGQAALAAPAPDLASDRRWAPGRVVRKTFGEHRVCPPQNSVDNDRCRSYGIAINKSCLTTANTSSRASRSWRIHHADCHHRRRQCRARPRRLPDQGRPRRDRVGRTRRARTGCRHADRRQGGSLEQGCRLGRRPRRPRRSRDGLRRARRRARWRAGRQGRRRRLEPPDAVDGRHIHLDRRRAPNKLPGTSVVKAFNTAFASRQADPQVAGITPDGFVAGDDATAKQTVLDVVESIGFRPVDAGSLAARGPSRAWPG